MVAWAALLQKATRVPVLWTRECSFHSSKLLHTSPEPACSEGVGVWSGPPTVQSHQTCHDTRDKCVVWQHTHTRTVTDTAPLMATGPDGSLRHDCPVRSTPQTVLLRVAARRHSAQGRLAHSGIVGGRSHLSCNHDDAAGQRGRIAAASARSCIVGAVVCAHLPASSCTARSAAGEGSRRAAAGPASRPPPAAQHGSTSAVVAWPCSQVPVHLHLTLAAHRPAQQGPACPPCAGPQECAQLLDSTTAMSGAQASSSCAARGRAADVRAWGTTCVCSGGGGGPDSGMSHEVRRCVPLPPRISHNPHSGWRPAPTWSARAMSDDPSAGE